MKRNEFPRATSYEELAASMSDLYDWSIWLYTGGSYTDPLLPFFPILLHTLLILPSLPCHARNPRAIMAPHPRKWHIRVPSLTGISIVLCLRHKFALETESPMYEVTRSCVMCHHISVCKVTHPNVLWQSRDGAQTYIQRPVCLPVSSSPRPGSGESKITVHLLGLDLVPTPLETSQRHFVYLS